MVVEAEEGVMVHIVPVDLQTFMGVWRTEVKVDANSIKAHGCPPLATIYRKPRINFGPNYDHTGVNSGLTRDLIHLVTRARLESTRDSLGTWFTWFAGGMGGPVYFSGEGGPSANCTSSGLGARRRRQASSSARSPSSSKSCTELGSGSGSGLGLGEGLLKCSLPQLLEVVDRARVRVRVRARFG